MDAIVRCIDLRGVLRAAKTMLAILRRKPNSLVIFSLRFF
jgi:hypothetical protein